MHAQRLTDHVEQDLVAAHAAVRIELLTHTTLEHRVQGAYLAPIDGFFDIVENPIERPEVVPHLDHVFRPDLVVTVLRQQRARIVQLSCLLGRAGRTLQVIRVVREQNLCVVLQAATHALITFTDQSVGQSFTMTIPPSPY